MSDDITSKAIARKAAYERAHKFLDLHEKGYAVREYCLPEDDFRFVLHGKRYLTTSEGGIFKDIIMMDGEVCILSETLRRYGEVA